LIADYPLNIIKEEEDMNELSSNQINKHVTVLGVLYIGMSLVSLAIAVGLFLLLSGIGIAVDDPVARRVLVTVGTVIAFVLSITSFPSLIAGIGLLMRRAWGRILALILAVFKLFNIPIGTAIGIYAFWVLMKDEAVAYFSTNPQPETISEIVE
jgi:hypothetical protein